jgi:hypothetical protein
LKYVELGEGGRGKKGGISEYARQIGKESSRTRLNAYKDGAIVYLKIVTYVPGLREKAGQLGNHLAEIIKAPEQYWVQLGKLLIEKEWSVKQTEAIAADGHQAGV